MKITALILLFVSLSLRVASAQETDHPYLTYHPLSARLGLGSTVNPSTPLILIDGEYNFDRFMALGAMIQGGMGQHKKIFMPTLGGRFNIPLYPTERVNLSVQSGVGLVRRSAFGASFVNFAYEFGTDVDVYLMKNLTVGLGAILNVTSSRVERRFGSLYASASYRY